MASDNPVSDQLVQQLMAVRDNFAKWAGGTHQLNAYLMRKPRDLGLLARILRAIHTRQNINSAPRSTFATGFSDRMGVSWRVDIIGDKEKYAVYASLASAAMNVVHAIGPTAFGLSTGFLNIDKELDMPIETGTSFGWTELLFWLALGVDDLAVLNAEVRGLDVEKPPPVGHCHRILQKGPRPDSDDWPEMGFALLDCDVFTGSRYVCDWLLAQIDPCRTALSATRSQENEESTPGESRSEYRFLMTGNTWDISFGEEEGTFSDLKGFHIIATLLRQPNPLAAILAMDLQKQGTVKANVEHTFEETLDADAIAAHKKRIADLDHEIEKVRKNNDEAENTRLAEEKQKILDQLAKDIGTGGRARRLGPDDPHEKARKAVNLNLSTVYKTLENATPPLPKLVEHLKVTIKAAGATYAYRYQSPFHWQLD